MIAPCNIGVIVQARMGSERLPGKSLKNLLGKAMIGHLLERLRSASIEADLVLATSDQSADQDLYDWCAQEGFDCHRGDLHNVAERFGSLIRNKPWIAFARVSGDSPFYDPSLLVKGIQLFKASNADLVTNVFPRSFPKGQSVEIVRSETFLKILPQLEDSLDQEHVTRYFYQHSDAFSIVNFSAQHPMPELQLSIDTAEDWDRAEQLISSLERPLEGYGWEELALHFQKTDSISKSIT